MSVWFIWILSNYVLEHEMVSRFSGLETLKDHEKYWNYQPGMEDGRVRRVDLFEVSEESSSIGFFCFFFFLIFFGSSSSSSSETFWPGLKSIIAPWPAKSSFSSFSVSCAEKTLQKWKSKKKNPKIQNKIFKNISFFFTWIHFEFVMWFNINII